MKSKASKKNAARREAIRLKIEMEQLIKEVHTKSYEVVRLRRVKYAGNDYSFIDIRFFQRGSDDNGDDVYFPSRKGVQIREDLFFKLVDEHFMEMLDRQIKQSRA
jgi:hypothetical protein